MVAGAVAGQAANAAAGKTAGGVPKAAGKSAGNTGGRFGIQTPSQEERQNKAGSFLSKKEAGASQNNINYTGVNHKSNHSSLNLFKQKNGEEKRFNQLKTAKSLPLIIGFLLPLLPIILIFSAGTLLFADIDENTQESMDVQYLAMRKVAQTAVKIMLQNGSLPSTFAETLTENGLEVGYLDTNGTFIAGLRPNSENSITLASSKTGEKSEVDNSLVLRLGETIIDADSWDYFAETNADVYLRFKNATYGRAAGHYDNAADAFYSTINASRNVFSAYTSPDNITDFKDILDKYYTNTPSTGYGIASSEKCNKSTDVCKPESNKTDTFVSTRETAIETYLETLYENTLIDKDDCAWHSEVICKAEEYLNITDTTMLYDDVQAAVIAYLVNTAVNANETYESMKYFLTLEEIMSKTKAGDGSMAPINELMSYLTTADENGVSAVQSDTLSSVLTKSFANYDDKEAQKYSVDRTQNITTGFSYNNSALKEAIDAAGLSLTGLIINSSAGSYGASDNSLSVIKILKEPQKSDYNCVDHDTTDSECTKYDEALAAYEEYKNDQTQHPKTREMITKLTTYLNSQDITFLTDEGFNSISGSHSGELFAKGASILGSKIATFGEGGTIGTKESIATYQKETNKLLAWEAEVERSERSPFDTTSQDTFLGNIVHSISSYLYTSTSFLSFSNILKDSFASLLPGAFADTESSFQTTYGECPESSEEFACSVYSYPQTTFDLTNLENYIERTKNAEKEETASESYIMFEKYNNQRSTNVGYLNTQIADELWEKVTASDKAIRLSRQFIEFAKNKLFQFFSNEERIYDYFSTYYTRFTDEEMQLITGSTYINASSTKDEQAYSAYSRFLDQIGYFSEENTNTAQFSNLFIPGTGKSEYIASLENYAEEFKNLSDTEYLARISGISEDEANLVLGYITYNSYLASIDHDSVLAFGREDTFNLETSNQSEPTTQLAVFNSEAKTINSSSKRREITYAA